MRETPAEPGAGGQPLISAQTDTGAGVRPPVRMRPHITAAEALAVFRRKLPGAHAEAGEVVHPFWWVPLTVATRSLFARRAGDGQRMDILVNAVSGRGLIADFTPSGEVSVGSAWSDLVDELSSGRPVPDQSEAAATARSLARTKVLKTVKLGMGIEISPADGHGPRALLKPNWLVTGANEKHTATILVDGLDGSHYIVRAEKVSSSSSHS